jgi:hypothetical protein
MGNLLIYSAAEIFRRPLMEPALISLYCCWYNLKTGKTLNLEVPATLLARADANRWTKASIHCRWPTRQPGELAAFHSISARDQGALDAHACAERAQGRHLSDR